MQNLSICLDAVLPLFLMMALGYCSRCAGLISSKDVPRINAMAFRVFMPVMLFNNVYSSDLSAAFRLKPIIFAAVGICLVFAVSVLYVLHFERDVSKRGAKIQAMFRSNFVIIGLPLTSSLAQGQELGTIVVLVAIIVPIYNVLAVLSLEIFNGTKPKPVTVLLGIIKNPMILGTVAGLLCVLLKIRLPSFLLSTVRQVGSATTPLMLFLLGAFFDFSGFAANRRDIAEVCLWRLIIFPGIFLTAAMLLGIRGVDFAGMIPIFGSAAAVASFTMAQQMGADAELAGDLVVATSALCPFTLLLWSVLFKTLGVY